MTSKQILAGLGAFVGGAVALVAAAVAGESYIANRPPPAPTPEPQPEPAASAGPALMEAPHVAEERDGPVDQSPAAVIQDSGTSGQFSVSSPAARADTSAGSGEHVPTDLLADAVPGATRAPDAFRPDPTAPVSPEMRDSLRPATGPAPSLVANEGESVTEALGSG